MRKLTDPEKYAILEKLYKDQIPQYHADGFYKYGSYDIDGYDRDGFDEYGYSKDTWD